MGDGIGTSPNCCFESMVDFNLSVPIKPKISKLPSPTEQQISHSSDQSGSDVTGGEDGTARRMHGEGQA